MPFISKYLQMVTALLISLTWGIEAMLITSLPSENGVVLAVSGRLEVEDIAELQSLIGREGVNGRITLDLKDVTLVSRDVVKFLTDCEAMEAELKNCPGYVREWIAADKSSSSGHSTSGTSQK
jgi:hypothetical protein